MSHSNRSRVLLFDLAHKYCNGIIKGWLHCLTSESKGRFVSNMNVWVSMMSGHGANPMVPAGNIRSIIPRKQFIKNRHILLNLLVLKPWPIYISRSSHWKCSIKQVLKYFAKFPGKYLCRSLFLISCRPPGDCFLLRKKVM